MIKVEEEVTNQIENDVMNILLGAMCEETSRVEKQFFVHRSQKRAKGTDEGGTVYMCEIFTMILIMFSLFI